MNGTFELAVRGIGLVAPGLDDWTCAHDVLAGHTDYRSAPLPRQAPGTLAANERRRAPDSVLLAVAVAEQACAAAQCEPGELPNVFASTYGDLSINDYLCRALAAAPLDLSPTKFHNSVHNAAAGYWTIATHCMATSSALSAGRQTFAAGFLEAALLAACEATAVLFVAYDIVAGRPLDDVADSAVPFGVAFVLAPAAPGAGARVAVSLTDEAAADLAPMPASLQALQSGNPIGACLPLLSALAQRRAGGIDLALPAAASRPHPYLHLEISF